MHDGILFSDVALCNLYKYASKKGYKCVSYSCVRERNREAEPFHITLEF